jgi:O-antigen ligase
LLILLTVLPIGALVLSASRGGITIFLFEFVLLTFLVRRPGKEGKHLLKAGALALVSGLFAIWLGVGWTVERFENLTRGDISHNRRVAMLRDTWQIFQHHPWAGTGLGTLESVYPRYESYYDGLVVDHAHNDYVELLADTGLVGGVCMLGFVALLVWRGLSNLRATRNPISRSFYCGSLVACVGLLLHSMIDFNLHIPSNTLVFFLLAAMATCSIAEPGQSQPQTSP